MLPISISRLRHQRFALVEHEEKEEFEKRERKRKKEEKGGKSVEL